MSDSSSTTSSQQQQQQQQPEAGEGQRSFIMSLLQDAMASAGLESDSNEPLSFDANITIEQDRIAHLPCRYSKTWRKAHGWSDLPSGSVHSDSRWKSAEFSSCQVISTTPVKVPEPEVCGAPPSPPKRQSSCSSTDLARILQFRRQSSNSSLGSSSTSSTSKKKTSFQYPPTLGQLPEDSASSFLSAPPARNNSSTTSFGTTSISSFGPMIMPQRQESDKSFGRSTAQQRLSESSNSSMGSSLASTIPMSLFSAPSMPQRQESVSTLGSRQSSFSTLSTQDSFRSLNSGLQSQQQHPQESCRSLVSTPESIQEEESPKEFKMSFDDTHSSGSSSCCGGVPPPPPDLVSSPGSVSSDDHSNSTGGSSSKKKFDLVYVPPTDPSRLQQNRRFNKSCAVPVV